MWMLQKLPGMKYINFSFYFSFYLYLLTSDFSIPCVPEKSQNKCRSIQKLWLMQIVRSNKYLVLCCMLWSATNTHKKKLPLIICKWCIARHKYPERLLFTLTINAFCSATLNVLSIKTKMQRSLSRLGWWHKCSWTVRANNPYNPKSFPEHTSSFITLSDNV